MQHSLAKLALIAGSLLATLAGMAHADVLLDDTQLIAATTVASDAELPFTTTTAQALTVTLSDLKTPAAFSSLQIAVTLGDTLVGSATVDPTSGKTTLAIPAAVGDYVLRVIGTPVAAADATVAIGSFEACVSLASDTTGACIAADSFSANIETPAPPSTTPSSALQTNFTSTVAGSYTVTITDDTFPVALQSVSGGITQGSTPVNTASLGFGANQVTLAANTTYTLILGALADANVQAGLYGVNIADPSNNAIFFQTVPVGKMPAATSVSNPTAQALSLALNDLGYPSPLTTVGVAVTFGASSLASLTATGAVPNFSAPAGNLQIWQFATSSGQPGVYSFNLANATTTTSLIANTQVVNPSATSGQTFAFVENLTAAGTYSLTVTDFQFPSALASAPTVTVAQNGAALTLSSSNQFAAAAGYVVVVVNAAPPATGSGIFGVTVATTGASPQILLDQTQTVGGQFSTQAITAAASGNYDVTLADLGFPGNFQDLAVIVSQGSTVLGKIFGGGTFTISAVPGSYNLTFVDTPASTLNYGLYSIKVASSVPTLTFTAGATSVTSGGTVQLTWSSANTTACTASGSPAWTGTEPLTGSTSVILDSTSALVLTCTGPGGSVAQTVNVSVTAVAAKSGGGGGGMSPAWLGVLGAIGAVGGWRRRQRAVVVR